MAVLAVITYNAETLFPFLIPQVQPCSYNVTTGECSSFRLVVWDMRAYRATKRSQHQDLSCSLKT